MKILKILSVTLLAAALVACGGGGGSPGATGGGSTPVTTSTGTVTPPATTPGSIDVQASANELLSAGTEVTVTVVVKSATNVGMAEQTVTFEVDNRATLKGVSAKTDADGVATARLSAGAKDLRNVTVTVKAGTATGVINLPVVGTRLSLTGPGNVKLGETLEYIVRAVDSADAPISGVPLSVSSVLGNSLTSIPVTDSTGQAKFFYTANVAGSTGNDTLNVTGHGAASQIPIAISSEDFVYVTPSANTNVAVNTPTTVQVAYKVAGNPQQGVNVQFSTTRGVLSASTAVTNASGIASVQLQSSSAGPSNLLARIATSQISLPVRFIATNPNSLVLQVNPGAVLPNTAGGTANQVTIDAKVQDDAGNPVANQLVDFTIGEDDGNGGSLSSPSALTDVNGRASVQFVPGSKSTKKDGVVLLASVSGTAINGTAAITVNGQALNISIGFGNTIGNVDDTAYIKAFSVFVTDATGNPVANQPIVLSTSPVDYLKGTLDFNGVVWAYTPGGVTSCANEDLDFDGVLDEGEDFNGNKLLTPGNPIVVSPGTVRTDGAGRATFSLTYGEQFAPWMTIDLTARGSVGGTESRSSLRYFVNGLASDFNVETVAPAGQVSPFGRALECENPN